LKQPMNIKAIAEVMSAFAVIISLVFVGMQMAENTRATRSSIAAETTATISEWYNSLSDNAETSQVMRAFMRDPSTLTPDGRYRGAMKFHSLMLIFQSAYYLEEQGTLDAKIRDSMTKVLQSVGAQKGVAYYWAQRRATFTNKNFIAFIDKSLEREDTFSESLYADPAE